MKALQRILITNDDGVYAPGIKVLQDIALQLCDDVWIVAPEVEQSGAGHSLTLRRPLRIRKISEKRYGVDGTPTDCTMMGVQKVLKDMKPCLVLSGINYGANLGEDVTYSGTVAAAMEATLLGIPSMALSLVTIPNQPVKWSTPQQLAPDLIRRLIEKGWPSDVMININFPNAIVSSVKGVKVVKQGLRASRDDLIEWHDPRGVPCYWIGGADRLTKATENHTDIEAVANGYIAITPLHLDLTHGATLKKLQHSFAESS